MSMSVDGVKSKMLFPLQRVLSRLSLLGGILFLLISFTDKAAFAGPWTLKKGSLYVNYSVVSTNFEKVKLFDGSGKFVGKVRTISNNFFVKYGALENLDVHVSFPYELASLEGDSTATFRKFGDGRLGFQYRFLRENENSPISAALAFEWKTPLSTYSANSLSSLGDHQEDFEYRFLLGRYFNIFELSSYFNVEGGYRTRTGKPSDEVFGFAEMGMLFTPKFAGRVFVDGVDALGGIGLESAEFMAIMTRDGSPPFCLVGENYIKTGLGFSFYPTDSVDIGIFWSIPVYRSNTSLDRSIGISVGYKFF